MAGRPHHSSSSALPTGADVDDAEPGTPGAPTSPLRRAVVVTVVLGMLIVTGGAAAAPRAIGADSALRASRSADAPSGYRVVGGRLFTFGDAGFFPAADSGPVRFPVAKRRPAPVRRPAAPARRAPAPAPAPAPVPALVAAPVVAPAPPSDLGQHPFLVCTRAHESDTAGGYRAVSPGGTYRGAYQFLPSTWDNTARHAGRPDLVGVDPAAAAPADQDLLAYDLYRWQGSSPWGGRCSGM